MAERETDHPAYSPGPGSYPGPDIMVVVFREKPDKRVSLSEPFAPAILAHANKTGRKGAFRSYQLPEPQPRGAVTRRAVAQRRSRASGLTRPLAEAIRGLVY